MVSGGHRQQAAFLQLVIFPKHQDSLQHAHPQALYNKPNENRQQLETCCVFLKDLQLDA